MRPRFSCVDTLLRCTAAAFVTLAAVRPVSVAAQQLVLNTPYQGRYRCGEEWKDATLIVTKMKGDQFEGTFALAGRLFKVGRAPARQMREAPKVKGTFSAGGGVVVRWEDKLMLRYDDSAERSVMFQGILSREGTLNGTLDYRGCDKLTAALPGATQGEGVVGAVPLPPTGGVTPSITRSGGVGRASAPAPQANIDAALADTLLRILRYADVSLVIERFADYSYVNSQFRGGSPEFLTRVRDTLFKHRDATINRLAEANMDFRYLTPTLNGIAQGALVAKVTVIPSRKLEAPRMQEMIAEYLKRRAAQWRAAGATALVRAELAQASTLDQLVFQRQKYISAVDDPTIPVLRDLLAYVGARAAYLQKSDILGGAIAPEGAARPRIASAARAPTAEEIYDAFTVSLASRDTALASARRWCEQQATRDRFWTLATPPELPADFSNCATVMWADLGAEPLMTVVRFERRDCVATSTRGVWRCDFTVNANSKSIEFALLATLSRAVDGGPTEMFERQPTERDKRDAMTGAIDSRYDKSRAGQDAVGRAMERVPLPFSARFAVRHGQWVMLEDTARQ